MIKLNKKLYQKMLLIALAVCLVSMIGSTLVNTNMGKIDVENFSIEDANGNLIACQMYKPKTATAETPAPCVITLHGSFDAKETQDYTCLELAKRGVYHMYFVSTDEPGRRYYERHGVRVFRSFTSYKKDL